MKFQTDTLPDRRLDSLERAITDVRVTLRWVIGIQLTTLIALGSLLFSILSKLP